jgi:hypothetical protein
MLLLMLSLIINCSLLVYSDTTWHESNHHLIPPSLNQSSIDTIFITIQVQRKKHQAKIFLPHVRVRCDGCAGRDGHDDLEKSR